jgi:hypothetical protein
MDIIDTISPRSQIQSLHHAYFRNGHRFSCHVGISSGEAKGSSGSFGCTIAVDISMLGKLIVSPALSSSARVPTL